MSALLPQIKSHRALANGLEAQSAELKRTAFMQSAAQQAMIAQAAIVLDCMVAAHRYAADDLENQLNPPFLVETKKPE